MQMPLLVLRLAVVDLVLRMQCGVDCRLPPASLHLSKMSNGQTYTVDKANHSWVKRTKHTEISRSIDASLLSLAFIGVVLVKFAFRRSNTQPPKYGFEQHWH